MIKDPSKKALFGTSAGGPSCRVAFFTDSQWAQPVSCYGAVCFPQFDLVQHLTGKLPISKGTGH